MVVVYTKEQLADTLKKGETALVKGQLATDIRKKYEKNKKVKKGGLIAGGIIAAAGLAAAPFTGGASLAGTAAGITAMGLTIGSITVSAAELAILCGVTVALYGVSKGAKVTFNKDGNVIVEPK